MKLYEQTESAVEDFAVLFEFWKSGDATEEETKEAYAKASELIEDAELKATLNEPEDALTVDGGYVDRCGTHVLRCESQTRCSTKLSTVGLHKSSPEFETLEHLFGLRWIEKAGWW